MDRSGVRARLAGSEPAVVAFPACQGGELPALHDGREVEHRESPALGIGVVDLGLHVLGHLNGVPNEVPYPLRVQCINHLEKGDAGRLYVDEQLVGYAERNGRLYEIQERQTAHSRWAAGMVSMNGHG